MEKWIKLIWSVCVNPLKNCLQDNSKEFEENCVKSIINKVAVSDDNAKTISHDNLSDIDTTCASESNPYIHQ